MKKICFSLLLLFQLLEILAKEEPVKSEFSFRLPLSIGFQFQNFALPFKDIKSNFTHPGLFIGTEIVLNKRGNLIQQIHLAGYLNKEMGEGFQLYSQISYRPGILKHLHPELKIGIGWTRTYHPVDAYRYEKGKWVKTADGKSQLIIPVGLGIEYSRSLIKPHIVPFLCYQVIPDLFYNDIIPLSFHNVIQMGAKIYL
jgi:hypothetical protein